MAAIAAAALGTYACDAADEAGLGEPDGQVAEDPRDAGDTGVEGPSEPPDTGVHDTGVHDLGVMDIGHIDAGGCACLPPVEFGRHACSCDVVEWGCADAPQTFQMVCDVPPSSSCYGHEIDPTTGCPRPVFLECFESCLNNFDAG